MILHDFIYEWDGKSRSGKAPITWWPGAYRVRIVTFAGKNQDIHYLFPTAVFLKGIRKEGTLNASLKNYIHNFAEKISEKYGLNPHKTIWVELEDPVLIAQLKPDRHLTDKTFFSFTWRKAHPHEMDMFDPFILDLLIPGTPD